MKFITMRGLRNQTTQVIEELDEETGIVTSNGRPVGTLLSVEKNFEETHPSSPLILMCGWYAISPRADNVEDQAEPSPRPTRSTDSPARARRLGHVYPLTTEPPVWSAVLRHRIPIVSKHRLSRLCS
jgi:hypothetical protein